MTDPDAGIEPTWVDAFRIRRAVTPAVRDALRATMGLRPGERPPAPRLDPVRLVRGGERLDPAGEVTLEDGTALGHLARLPRDLPLGHHSLRVGDLEQRLIAAPPACHLPADLRTWGWSVQLYAARSRGSWGIGDLGDLRTLASWSRDLDAGAMFLNPLGAPNPGPRPEPSPYYPSTRRFRDPLAIRIEAIPGSGQLGDRLAPLVAAGRALNATRRIDRSRILALKREALEAIWTARAADHPPESLAAYRAAVGPALRGWATFAVLTERFGPGWRRWPERYRDPASGAVARYARDHADKVAFHEWVQSVLDQQLAAAAAVGPRLVADLPIGFDPGGFDAWEWRAELADGASIGAPPDLFNPIGQDWGMQPFVPHRLRAEGYRPFIDTLRAAMRHAGGLRIDHVLGLFRLWWVAPGAVPADGAYVRNRGDELLALLSLESHRAGAVIVGEDLGTVELGVRRRLAARRILATRLGYFERRPPAEWTRIAVASVTTHDLPTLAGAWTRADLDDQQRSGVARDVRGLSRIRHRLAAVADVAPDAPVETVALAAYGAVAASPSILVSATLDDAARVLERPNHPGTTSDRRANWALALPKPIDALRRDPFVRRLAAAIREGRRRPPRGG